MAQILRRVAVSGLGLTLAAFFAFAGTASAQSEITVGGQVEVIGGTSDHDKGNEGFDRGLFSRINLGYSKTLENGLEINAAINDIVHQEVDYAPSVVFMSVGGGFGTVTMGNHAPAACATMPRPIALVPGGVNATWHGPFMGTKTTNITHSEYGYCATPTAISYSTPSMGGLSAMVTYAPNTDSDQIVSVGAARKSSTNAEDYMAIAAKFSTDMGGMNLNLGAAFQTAADDMIDSVTVAGTIGVGAMTVGASWYDNGDPVETAAMTPAKAAVYGTDKDGSERIKISDATEAKPASYLYRSGYEGWTVGANYALGAIKPAITYSSQENSMMMIEETALVVGVSYAVGGGVSVFAEYFGIETETKGVSDDETILMSGVIVGF